MGKEATGGAIAVPIFGSFMKMALADKPATPFRIPPGIKLVRVNPSTGLRAGGDSRSVLEAFKPDEEPDDPYSIIGFTDETGGFTQPQSDQDGSQSPSGGGWAPRTERSGGGRGEDARALTRGRGLW
jgi:penicillin-binding protein 1A